MNFKPLLNILIRTSNRPNYFNRLIANIKSQRYATINLVISADTPFTSGYVVASGHRPTNVKQLSRSADQTFPWNLYLNRLMDEVNDGWIVFMDDDDMYAHKNSLGMIASNLPDENSMLVWQMRFPDGRLVPNAEHMGTLPFVRKQIAMPCFAFHSKWKNAVRFDGQRAGDYRISNQLQRFLKVEWLQEPLVQLDNYGNVGKEVDLI